MAVQEPTKKNGLKRFEHNGLAPALGAYTIWGFLPLYLILVESIHPTEFVGWRIIWTLPFCIIIVIFRKQFEEVSAALMNPKAMATLCASSAFIALNWFVYVWAVQSGEIYAASLGYYINPLLNVLMGTIFLKERLSKEQWMAVGLATLAILVLVAGAVSTLWISLTLAVSFSTYGLIRKKTPVGSLPGLTIESGILLPMSVFLVWWYSSSPGNDMAFGQDLFLSLVIIAGGLITAVPLLLFADAARKMDYSTLGFIQFLAPSIVFLLGLTVFQKELVFSQMISFGLIWSAIAIFISDLSQKRREPASA